MKRPQPQQAAAVAAAAAAEQTMALYDACWFRRLVLLPSPAPASSSSSSAPRPAALPAQNQQAPLEREVDTHTPRAHQRPSSTHPTAAAGGLRHRRTRSDEATAAAFQGMEPLRLPDAGNRARLETILSGKDGLVVAAPQPQPLPGRRRPAGPDRRRRRRRGRSMSELEFEEVKGLQDLGFTFSDADVDPELASIVPGLRRKRSEEENSSRGRATASAPAATATYSARAEAVNDDASVGAVEAAPRRPYLSEAWDDEEEEVRRALRNWRIPPAGDGDQLKEHLRMWAHTVASAVR